MKKSLLLACVTLLAVLLAVPGATYAQIRNVTFVVNTATMPDTIMANSPVNITGASPNDTAATTALTNWGSGVALTNVGGDYWTKTLQINNNAELRYKIRLGANGWEQNLTPNNDRTVVVTSDTVLPVQYWNNGHFAAGNNPPYYATPWAAAADTFLTVWMRVNIKGIADNALNGWTTADYDSVGVLGGGPAGSNLDWGTIFYLTREQAPTNSPTAFAMPPGTFYSGAVRIPKSQVTPGQDIAYKFRLGSNWNYGSTQRSEQLGAQYAGGNRHFTIPVGEKDTTLMWVHFGDTKPTSRANTDTVVVTWRVDVTTARNRGSFNIGDTLQVQSGWFNTTDSLRTHNLQRVGLTNIYTGIDTVRTSLNRPLDYQYYLVKNGATVREYFYNFQWAGDVQSEAERRQIVPTSRTFVALDTVNSVTSGRRQPFFENQRKLTKAVKVTWQVDVRPAYYQVFAGDTLKDIQGSGANVISADSIKRWGVGINGPATGGPNGPLPDEWAPWNATMVADTSKRKLWDDGTHGDKTANDTIYTVQFSYTTANTIGKIFKFGIRGGDNESAFGLNHLENLSDVDTVFTVDTQWGSINPNFYNRWDYDLRRPRNPNGVTELGGMPTVYALEQNYPNPFNPATKIEFALPRQAAVELKVFNVLGQEVATLVRETLNAGRHVVSFNAANLASGLYFYRITAGDFTSVKKMMLVK